MAEGGAVPEISIDQLLAAQPYNPEIIPDLEAYVDKQIATGSYHLDANLALLRLYQFEPSRVNRKKMAQILIKSMMVLPRVDCSLCIAVISEAVLSEPPVSTLVGLANLLESAQFAQFWTEVGLHKELLADIPGFDEAIRSYAIHVLALTFKRVPRHVVAEAVNINGPTLDDFIQAGVKSRGWFVSKTKNGEVIELGTPGAEPFLHKGAVEAIPLEHIARLFPMLS